MMPFFECNAQCPAGNIISCSYTKSKAAAGGTDNYRIYISETGEAIVEISLNENCFYDRNPKHGTFTVSLNKLKALQRMVEKKEIYKVNGYNERDARTGGTTYRFRILYDSGESISLSYYLANPKVEARNAVGDIEAFFAPWIKQM